MVGCRCASSQQIDGTGADGVGGECEQIAKIVDAADADGPFFLVSGSIERTGGSILTGQPLFEGT